MSAANGMIVTITRLIISLFTAGDFNGNTAEAYKANQAVRDEMKAQFPECEWNGYKDLEHGQFWIAFYHRASDRATRTDFKAWDAALATALENQYDRMGQTRLDEMVA